MVHKSNEEPEFQCGQIDFGSAFRYDSFLGVDRDGAQHDNALGFPASAKDAANAAHQLARAKWLSNIVICAHVQPAHYAIFIPGCGEENDGKPVPLCSLTDGKTIPLCKRNVQEQQVDVLVYDCSKRFPLLGNRDGLKAFGVKIRVQRSYDCNIVLDDQDF